MFKKLIPLVAVPLALLAPSLAHAGETRTLAVSATTTSVTTLEDTVIDFTYTCNGWASGGTVQFFIQGGTPTNIGDPITIPNIALTSFQFTGSITYAFPTAGTYVVDAKVVGTVDGGAGSSCDIATVNSGTADHIHRRRRHHHDDNRKRDANRPDRCRHIGRRDRGSFDAGERRIARRASSDFLGLANSP